MKFLPLLPAFMAIGLMLSPAPVRAAEVGKPAPDFTATDTKGETVSLSALKGKIVVLEWTNSGCPFVRKHYDSGNMQKVQKDVTASGATWISIVSSAPGKQGHMTAEEANKLMTSEGAAPTALIQDEKGELGKLYGAKTTPHMFVIDKEGTLAYAGAIDDSPSVRPESLEGATNYVRAAVDALVAGKPVEIAETQPYGCGVKY